MHGTFHRLTSTRASLDLITVSASAANFTFETSTAPEVGSGQYVISGKRRAWNTYVRTSAQIKHFGKINAHPLFGVGFFTYMGARVALFAVLLYCPCLHSHTDVHLCRSRHVLVLLVGLFNMVCSRVVGHGCCVVQRGSMASHPVSMCGMNFAERSG